MSSAHSIRLTLPLFHFSFVLLDLQMPVLDGFGSCRLMREVERSRSTRSLVLALTGLSSSDDRKQAFTAGMDD